MSERGGEGSVDRQRRWSERERGKQLETMNVFIFVHVFPCMSLCMVSDCVCVCVFIAEFCL